MLACPNCSIRFPSDVTFPVRCVCKETYMARADMKLVAGDRRMASGQKSIKPQPPPGPGTELAGIRAELGLSEAGCGCASKERQMDEWGADGCTARHSEICGWLAELGARAKMLSNRPGWFDAVRPAASLLDEAIRRDLMRMPPPYSGPLKRNLIYHVGPFRSADKHQTVGYAWRRNVEKLLQYIDLFNGRRVVGVVTGPELEPPDEVRKAFRGEVEEFIVAPNDRRLREVVTFERMLGRIASTDPNELFFFGQAKGVTHPVNDGVTVHKWTDLMYEICLGHYPLVERLLANHACAGPFLRTGEYFKGSRSRWHYSGSFYWVRSCQLFSRHWRQIDQAWYGVESTIGGPWFSRREAACLFGQEKKPHEMDLYQMSYMARVLVEFEQWKRDHSHERTKT